MKQVTWEESKGKLIEGLYMNPDGFIFYVNWRGKHYNVMGNKRLYCLNYSRGIKTEIAKAIKQDEDFTREYKSRVES